MNQSCHGTSDDEIKNNNNRLGSVTMFAADYTQHQLQASRRPIPERDDII
jgi:cytochrome c553